MRLRIAVADFPKAPAGAAPWIAPDPALLARDSVTYAVQVNGKLRGEVEVPEGADEAAADLAAAQLLAGLEYKLNQSWSLFTEAKLSYSQISADLNGGGELETDLWSPAVAVGLTYRFPGN